MDGPQLLCLIGEIYEAALDPRHWDKVLSQLCQQFDIKSAALLIHDLETDISPLDSLIILPCNAKPPTAPGSFR